MDQLREQGQLIERLSKAEHDLIKEVHPQVDKIKEGIDEMMVAVKENAENRPSPDVNRAPDLRSSAVG